jgi:hypothetical protein
MRKLNQLAAAVAIVAAGASVPAGAAVLGGAGEALLIPLVVWSGGDFNDPACDGANNIFDPAQCDLTLGYTPAVDTVIELWVPGSVGYDDIPNIYTARNTTPTWGAPHFQAEPGGFIPADTQLTPADPQLLASANPTLHWFWFDKYSVSQKSDYFPVTPNDVVQISWTEAANGQHENEPGYMVIVNESARRVNGEATFSFFGNAWLTGAIHLDPADNRNNIGIGFPLIGGTIPVLAMNDGVDGPVTPGNTCAQPDALDSVKYRGGTPCAVSPLIAGFRSNRSDGVYDFFAFDLAMSNRLLPTIQVIWVDQNLGDPAAIKTAYPGNTALPNATALVDVFDLDELSCDTTLVLPDELNVVWIPPAYETNEATLYPWNQPFKWTTINDLLCVVTDKNPNARFTSGFVRYKMAEYIDTNVNKAQSAVFGFSLKIDGGVVNNDAGQFPDALVLLLESSLGHDLGTFKGF